MARAPHPDAVLPDHRPRRQEDPSERRIHRYSGRSHLVHNSGADLLRVHHRRPVPQPRDPVHRVVQHRGHNDQPRVLRGRPHLHDDAVLLVHLDPDLRVLHRVHGRPGTQEDEVLRRGLPVPDRYAGTHRLQQLPGDVHLLGGHGTVLLPADRILVLQAPRGRCSLRQRGLRCQESLPRHPYGRRVPHGRTVHPARRVPQPRLHHSVRRRQHRGRRLQHADPRHAPRLRWSHR